jgi:hypothetical protein
MMDARDAKVDITAIRRQITNVQHVPLDLTKTLKVKDRVIFARMELQQFQQELIH